MWLLKNVLGISPCCTLLSSPCNRKTPWPSGLRRLKKQLAKLECTQWWSSLFGGAGSSPAGVDEFFLFDLFKIESTKFGLQIVPAMFHSFALVNADGKIVGADSNFYSLIGKDEGSTLGSDIRNYIPSWREGGSFVVNLLTPSRRDYSRGHLWQLFLFYKTLRYNICWSNIFLSCCWPPNWRLSIAYQKYLATSIGKRNQ